MKREIGQKAYWRETRRLMFTTVVPVVALVIGLPYLEVRFSTHKLFGLPVGYLLTLPGFVIACVALIARFQVRQESIDLLHGTHDDT
jgi:putative solute:sodium symporter small subunit